MKKIQNICGPGKVHSPSILDRFHISDCKPVGSPYDPNIKLKSSKNENNILKNVPYQEFYCMYHKVLTRPDVGYAVNTLSTFNSKKETAAKSVLIYQREQKTMLALSSYLNIQQSWEAF